MGSIHICWWETINRFLKIACCSLYEMRRESSNYINQCIIQIAKKHQLFLLIILYLLLPVWLLYRMIEKLNVQYHRSYSLERTNRRSGSWEGTPCCWVGHRAARSCSIIFDEDILHILSTCCRRIDRADTAECKQGASCHYHQQNQSPSHPMSRIRAA